jgi:hypothetical protein
MDSSCDIACKIVGEVQEGKGPGDEETRPLVALSPGAPVRPRDKHAESIQNTIVLASELEQTFDSPVGSPEATHWCQVIPDLAGKKGVTLAR